MSAAFRCLALIVAAAGVLCPRPARAFGNEPEFLQAVEFPFGSFPRSLWERELVWMKNVGVRTIAFSVPANRPPSDPRGDLAAFLALLDRLDLRAWIRWAPDSDRELLAAHAKKPIVYWHGGPADSRPPDKVTVVSATDPKALLLAHQGMARGDAALIWTDVEDVLSPALRRGVVTPAGNESAGAHLLRRETAMLRTWGRMLPSLKPRRLRPSRLGAVQLANAEGWSLVRVANSTAGSIGEVLRAAGSAAGGWVQIPVQVPAGESMWLPVNIPLRNSGVCEDCQGMAAKDRIVYATAELHTVEWENGVLSFEFYAPVASKLVLQLSERPAGPLIARGHPADFEWDAATSTAGLNIPSGEGPQRKVRIGIAIKAPEQSAFFGEKPRLLLGHANRVVVNASSQDLAGRLRLLAPPDWSVRQRSVDALTADFEVSPSARTAHGEFTTLTVEADGEHLAHARVQALDPATVRLRNPVTFHIVDRIAALDPPLVTFDPRAGRRLTLTVRNNHGEIRNFHLAYSSDGVEVTPNVVDVSVGPGMESEVAVRLAGGVTPGPHEVRIAVSGAAALERRFFALPVRRGQAVAYRWDFDADGVADGVLETPSVRAVFSGSDGRWMEFVWKPTDANALPEARVLEAASTGTIRIENSGTEAALIFEGSRTIRMSGADGRLTIEQASPWRPPDLSKVSGGLAILRDSGSPAGTSYLLKGPENAEKSRD